MLNPYPTKALSDYLRSVYEGVPQAIPHTGGMMIKPKYSGYLSKKFWAKVNELEGPRCDAAYAMGVILQEVELHVLRYLKDSTTNQHWASAGTNEVT